MQNDVIADAPVPTAAVPGDPAAVERILSRAAGRSPAPAGAPPAPSSSPPLGKPGQSMHPAAVRARQRRADEKAKHHGQPAGSKFTGASFREIPLPPGEPVRIVPSPDDVQRATKSVAMILKLAGTVAAAVFKDDDMKVPDLDATETAAAIVNGWPELANGTSGDAAKVMAVAAVGSLVIERAGRYRRRPAALTPPAPAGEPVAQRMGAMAPLS